MEIIKWTEKLAAPSIVGLYESKNVYSHNNEKLLHKLGEICYHREIPECQPRKYKLLFWRLGRTDKTVISIIRASFQSPSFESSSRLIWLII